MKHFILISFSSCLFSISAQTFTIFKTTQPFYDIIEWKGLGGILMSKDPTNNSNQIYLTLVGDSDKSIWEQQFAPLNGKFYYVSSENARYVYFLRNLNPENGKIYFDQLNSAGNNKNTNVSLVSAIKGLGYDPYSLELKNVVVTDKALVHHFRYFDKKEKVYTDIATFITHHNMLVYAVELGKTREDELKAGRVNHYQYVGFSGDEICFSDYSTSKLGKGWNIIKFSSKGKELSRILIKDKSTNRVSFNTTGFGTNGAYYLNSENGNQNGLITYQNNSFYLTALSNNGGKSDVELYKLVDDDWEKINSFSISNSISKNSFSIGIYPQNEAMTYRITNKEVGDKTLALFLDGSKPILNSFTESVIYNPSRMIISDKKEMFAVTLPARNLIFDKSQLKSATNMEFEFIEK